MPIGFVGPALQGASMIGRFGVPLLQQAGISAGLAGLGAAAAALSNKPASASQGTRRGAAGKPRREGYSQLSSDQLPKGAYMTEAGRVYGLDSTQVGNAGGYMDEMGRVFLPSGASPGFGSSTVGSSQPALSSSVEAPRFAFSRGPAASASERAYQAEKSRVAQQTAQDPEFQRYERARQAAKTQEEMNAARDIGMQMWAKANPTLAAKVMPGQSGYDAIQGTLAGQAAAQGYGYQMPQQITMTPPPGVNAPQGLPATGSFGPVSTYGAQGLEVDPEMRKKFEALLNQAKA